MHGQNTGHTLRVTRHGSKYEVHITGCLQQARARLAQEDQTRVRLTPAPPKDVKLTAAPGQDVTLTARHQVRDRLQEEQRREEIEVALALEALETAEKEAAPEKRKGGASPSQLPKQQTSRGGGSQEGEEGAAPCQSSSRNSRESRATSSAYSGASPTRAITSSEPSP